MAGLLDYGTDPLGQGLLQMGAALMTPRALGGGLANGMLAFNSGAMQAQQYRRALEQDARRNKLTDAQIGHYEADAKYRDAQMKATQDKLAFDQSQALGQQAALADFMDSYQQAGGKWSPELSMKAMRAGVKGEDLERLAKGANLGREKLTWQNGLGLDPFSGEPRATAPDVNQPFFPSLVNGQIGAVPNAPVQQFQLNKAEKGATRVNTPVNLIQEREESKVVGAGMGKTFLDIQNSGMQARSKLNSLGRLETLLTGYETGKLAPLAKDVAAYAASVGIKIDPKLGDKEAAEALSNELALQARNPSGGAGMPGAMSDQDRAFLQNMVPGLSKSSGGNRMIIETQRRLAKREMDVARLAGEYRAKNGTLDPQFFQQLQQWADSNPLFSDMPAAQVIAPDGKSVSGTIGKAGSTGWSIKRVP